MSSAAYSLSPSGRGQDEGQREPRNALAVSILPRADLKTLIRTGCTSEFCDGDRFAMLRLLRADTEAPPRAVGRRAMGARGSFAGSGGVTGRTVKWVPSAELAHVEVAWVEASARSARASGTGTAIWTADAAAGRVRCVSHELGNRDLPSRVPVPRMSPSSFLWGVMTWERSPRVRQA
jgi:hypothetical protein